MAVHNELGKEGENIACQYLEKKGYSIIERNWRYDRHEIDIIVENDNFIVFVEVKTRTSTQWGNPEDFISKSQMKRIVLAADFYLKEYNIDKDARFDVISIVKSKDNSEIEHIDDAFLPTIC